MSTAIATGVKVDVHRESFLNALNAVSGVAPTKSPRPILNNVKLVATDAGSELLATDLEVSIRRVVGGVRVVESGAMILHPGRLKTILERADCEDLTIEADGDTIKIRGRRVRYDLPSEDADLFPDPPEFEATAYHVVQPADLRRLILLTQFSTEPESTRYALGGLLTEFRGDSIILVGTDGRRLSEATGACESVGEPGEFVNGAAQGASGGPYPAPVIGLKFLGMLLKSIKDGDPAVHVAIKPQMSVVVRTERATLYGRLVEGRFPKYLDMFDAAEYDASLTLNVGGFRRAIEQAAITVSEESRGIDFTFADGKLSLAAQACDVGRSEAELEIDFAGPKVELTFDPKYLLDPLRAIGDDAEIKLSLSPKGANLIEVEGARFMVMPLTRDR